MLLKTKIFIFAGAAIAATVGYLVLPKKEDNQQPTDAQVLPATPENETTPNIPTIEHEPSTDTNNITEDKSSEQPLQEDIFEEDYIEDFKEDNYEDSDFKFKRFAAQESTLDLRFA